MKVMSLNIPVRKSFGALKLIITNLLLCRVFTIYKSILLSRLATDKTLS